VSENATNETQPAIDGIVGAPGDATAAGVAEQPTGADETTTNVAISGAAADAAVGDVSGALSTMAVDPAGALTDAASHVAEGVRAHRNTPVTITQGQLLDLSSTLDELERIALFWGGERGTQIRNLVCRTRFDIFGK
jgi:hypothetical protein